MSELLPPSPHESLDDSPPRDLPTFPTESLPEYPDVILDPTVQRRHAERPSPPERSATNMQSLSSLDDLETQLDNLYGKDKDEDEISVLAATQRRLEDSVRANNKVASRPRPVAVTAPAQILTAESLEAVAAEISGEDRTAVLPPLESIEGVQNISNVSGGFPVDDSGGSPSSDAAERPVLSNIASMDVGSRSGAVSRGPVSKSEHVDANPTVTTKPTSVGAASSGAAAAATTPKQRSSFTTPKSVRSQATTPTSSSRKLAFGADSPSQNSRTSRTSRSFDGGNDAIAAAKLEAFRGKVEADKAAEKQLAADKLEADKAGRREAAKARIAARGEKSPAPFSPGNRTPAKP